MATTEPVANVVAPPPLLYAGALLVGGLFGRLVPGTAWPFDLAAADVRIAGFLLLGIGLLLMALGLLQFKRHGTPAPTGRPTTALVTTGIYGLSRNPMYVAVTAVYLGIGFILPSLPVLLLVVPLLVVMRYGVIAREERYLDQRFGEPYRAYRQRVRRWL